MPKVSIIVAIYNAEKYLVNTMRDLLNQTEKDIELIFVDDGSTDKSYQILLDYQKKDNRIIVKRIKNAGPGNARNIGLDIAKGEFIIFLDGDDFFSKELVEVLYTKAYKEDADITICSARFYDEKLNLEKPFKDALDFQAIPYGKNSFLPKEANTTLYQITGAFAWNKLFRASFLRKERLKFFNTYCYEDMALVYPALIRAKKIAVTHQELITYRTNTGKSLSDGKDKYWKELIQVISYLGKDLVKTKKYSLYEQTYLNKVATILTQAFKSYTNEEAFVDLFNFARKEMLSRLLNRDENFYYRKVDRNTMFEFINTNRPLEFALKIFNIKEQNAANITNRYWIFPYNIIKKDCRLVLFGAGDLGRDIYVQNKQSEWCNIVAWIDSVPEKYTHKGFPVNGKEVLREVKFDYLLICIRNQAIAGFIKEELISYGIKENQILFYPDMIEKDIAVCR